MGHFSISIAIFNSYLVGGLEHFIFFHILGIIIPMDFHISQRGGSTTSQLLVESPTVTIELTHPQHSPAIAANLSLAGRRRQAWFTNASERMATPLGIEFGYTSNAGRTA